jgi:hypothetical protein
MKTLLKWFFGLSFLVTALLSAIILITPLVIPYTYIKSIDTPYYDKLYGKGVIQDLLKEFSSMAEKSLIHNSSVKFKGIRPIYITEMGNVKTDDGYYYAGLTLTLPTHCHIQLSRGMDIVMLSLTLYHEYMHCFYIMHNTKNPCDLMAPVMNSCMTFQNVKYYSIYAGRILNDDK